MKSKLCVILALTVLLCCMGIAVSLAETSGKCGENVNWTLSDDGVLTIAGNGDIVDFEYRRSPFSNRRDIKEIVIENGITAIGANTFLSLIYLETITLPDSLQVIGERAFEGCVRLHDIVFPTSLLEVKSLAFRTCSQLGVVCIPASVQSIGASAFVCKGVKEFKVDQANHFYCSENGVLFDKEKTVLIQYPAADTNTTYQIPDCVARISEYAFYENAALTTVMIPASVEQIENWAFANCSKMAEFQVADGNAAYTAEDGVLFNRDKTCLVQYPAGKEDATYQIPASVSVIGTTAFRSSKLVYITIPQTVHTLKTWAFSYCRDLQSITIPNSILTMESAMFMGCTNLTELRLPNSIERISSDIIMDCKNLTGLWIPESVTNITSSNMTGCPNLVIHGHAGSYAETYANSHSIPFVAEDEESVSLDIPDMILPEGLVDIGEEAFYGCAAQVVLIQDETKGIGDRAFAYCPNLRQIVIPPSVLVFGDDIFQGVEGLIIFGEAGSAAERHANACGIRFVVLEN